MVKITVFLGGRKIGEGPIKDSSETKDPIIIESFSKIMRIGGSWKLEFINADPEEEIRWKRCGVIAKILCLWLNELLLLGPIEQNASLVTTNRKSLSPYSTGMPISSLPQKKEKPKAYVLNKADILFLDGDKITFIPASTKILNRKTKK